MKKDQGHQINEFAGHEHHHNHEIAEGRMCDGAGHVHHDHEDGTCCCEEHAKEFHGIDRKMLIRLILSALCYLAGMLLPVGKWIELILMAASALFSGYDILIRAIKNIIKRKFFDECFLMSFAAIAAFVIGEYEEGAAVFLLYCIGSFCQSYAIRESRNAIRRYISPQDEIQEPDLSNRFISRFAKIYTPVILLLALLIAVMLPVIHVATIKESVYRALTFLVLACPCAIVISVPLAYFAGIRSASNCKCFFSDSAAIDAVATKNQIEIKAIEVEGKQAYSCSYNDDTHILILEEKSDYGFATNIAKKTRRIATENIWFTIAIKVSVLILAMLGISALWFAVFADSGVTVIVVLNALRAFRVPTQNDNNHKKLTE